MRAMYDAIENRVGDRGIAKVFMPAVVGQLAGNDRRSVAVSAVEDLEEVLRCASLSPPTPQIVEDEDVDTREAGQYGRVRVPSPWKRRGRRR